MHDDSSDPRRDGDPGHLLVDEPAGGRTPHRLAALGVAAAVVVTLGAGAGAWAAVAGTASPPQATSADGTNPGGPSTGGGTGQGFGGGTGQGFGGGTGQGLGGSGAGGSQGLGGGSQGFGGSGGGTGTRGSQTQGDPASSAQTTGVVTIDTELGFDQGEAAGTGIVLTSSGRILTNNHVVDGATEIRVTDETTGHAYDAKVVGTNATRDIAVLQLSGASGLATATIASSAVQVGDDVTAVGNAGGTGTLTAASGSVTDTGQHITTEAEGSAAGETLRGLIETDADVVSGDSGGPLKDDDGRVVGVTTAATSGTDDPTGYAIPIADAMSIARQIVAGDDTDEITIGLPAFLGVSLAPNGDGAEVADVLDGTPAASTDLAAGDVITAVDGREIDSASDLTAAIGARKPGDHVRIGYTTPDGQDGAATVTLTEGPAD